MAVQGFRYSDMAEKPEEQPTQNWSSETERDSDPYPMSIQGFRYSDMAEKPAEQPIIENYSSDTERTLGVQGFRYSNMAEKPAEQPTTENYSSDTERTSGVQGFRYSNMSEKPAEQPTTENYSSDTERGSVYYGELSAEEEIMSTKIRKKIDLMVLPFVLVIYFLNALDRTNYSSARLQGLEKDLGLTGSQYQTGLAIFSVGYVLVQVPSNLVLNYIGRPSLYLGFFIVLWGLVTALVSQVSGYGGLIACRFIQGIVEGPFFAGVLFYLSKWYTKKELAFRTSLFFSAVLFSGAFGALIAAGVLSGLDGVRGYAAWQWLYILEGSVTCALGLLIVFVLPDFPETWKVLTPEMKRIAVKRIAVEAGETDEDDRSVKAQLRGFKLAFTDPKTYLFALGYQCIVAGAGFTNFFPTLTQSLGYSNIISLVLVAPPYIFMIIWSWTNSYFSDRKGTRFWFFIYPIPISIIGFIIFISTTGFGPRYFSFFLMIFVYAQYGPWLSWVSASLPRPPAKRAAALAFTNMLGNSALIWTPFTYGDRDGPKYYLAMGLIIGMQALAAVCAIAVRFWLKRQNEKLARLEEGVNGGREREDNVMGRSSSAGTECRKGFRYMV